MATWSISNEGYPPSSETIFSIFDPSFLVQVIQAVTFLSPNVGGQQQPLKGSRFHHPEKAAKNNLGASNRYIRILSFGNVEHCNNPTMTYTNPVII